MKQPRKNEIANLILEMIEALHPDNHGMITIDHYLKLRNQGYEAVNELHKSIR